MSYLNPKSKVAVVRIAIAIAIEALYRGEVDMEQLVADEEELDWDSDE